MLTNLKNKLEQKKGQSKQLQQLQSETKYKLKTIKRELINAEKAQIIIQEVSKIIQNQIKIHIEDIVSYALNSIFEEKYNFILEFINRRNKTECDIYIEKDGLKLNPMTDNGGGVIDIISFTCKLALWNLQKGNKNNTFILDEPCKFISRDLQSKVGELFKKLSEKLNIQFIIVSHISEIIENADKIFEIKMINKISQIKEIFI